MFDTIPFTAIEMPISMDVLKRKVQNRLFLKIINEKREKIIKSPVRKDCSHEALIRQPER